VTRLCRRGCLLDSIGSIVYSLFMDRTTHIWRPVIVHELRHEAGLAGAEHDINAARFVVLCVRYVLDRLGRLPDAFALDDDERFITAGWDLAYSSVEREASATEPLPAPQRTAVDEGDPKWKCLICGAADPDVQVLLRHVYDRHVPDPQLRADHG